LVFVSAYYRDELVRIEPLGSPHRSLLSKAGTEILKPLRQPPPLVPSNDIFRSFTCGIR
jgi:hypothetical protein